MVPIEVVNTSMSRRKMQDYRLEEMCRHGFQTPFDCPVCKGTVENKSSGNFVFQTEGGSVYHYSETCHSLVFGQQMVEERGGNPAPIERVAEDSAKLERPPCPKCRPKKKDKE